MGVGLNQERESRDLREMSGEVEKRRKKDSWMG